jgi:hypothetical protein
MLTIRKEQMDAFVVDLLVQYKERLLRELAAAFPEHFSRLGEKGMKAFIEHGVDTALQYRIKSEKDVAGFITIALRTTGDFDAMIQSEPVRNILEDDNLSGQYKVHLIHLQLTGRMFER